MGILQKMDCMETKQKYQTIKEQIKCDKKEKALIHEINVIERRQRNILKRIDCEYESDKMRINKRFNEQITALRKLSKYRCNGCDARGYDQCFVECIVCNKELCKECMLKCECCGRDWGSDEFYCCDDCDDRGECEGCFRSLCKYCFEKSQCEFCEKKVCEDCIEWFRDNKEDKEYWACKVCHKKQELQMIDAENY